VRQKIWNEEGFLFDAVFYSHHCSFAVFRGISVCVKSQNLLRITRRDIIGCGRLHMKRWKPHSSFSGSSLISRRVGYWRAKASRYKEKGKTGETCMIVKREKDGENKAHNKEEKRRERERERERETRHAWGAWCKRWSLHIGNNVISIFWAFLFFALCDVDVE